MEGLPSGDIQAKYQKLASEYSKVIITLSVSFVLQNTDIYLLSKFIVSAVLVASSREGAKKGCFR